MKFDCVLSLLYIILVKAVFSSESNDLQEYSLSNDNKISDSSDIAKAVELCFGDDDKIDLFLEQNAITCFINKGYEAVFIYIYDSKPNRPEPFSEKAVKLIPKLLEAGLHVELVIMPAVTEDTTTVVNTVITQLKNRGISTNFLWIDTYYLGREDYYPENVNKISDYISIFESYGIKKIGLINSRDVWITSMHNSTKFSLNLLWEDFDLKKFEEFRKYGGWTSASVISISWEKSCFTEYAEILYKKQSLLSSMKSISEIPRFLNISSVIILFFLGFRI